MAVIVAMCIFTHCRIATDRDQSNGCSDDDWRQGDGNEVDDDGLRDIEGDGLSDIDGDDPPGSVGDNPTSDDLHDSEDDDPPALDPLGGDSSDDLLSSE